ncbi:NYN domain-containing protein [Neisseria iguanae]|uniref:HTH OST-type domain-containing protein n=1 Tax=Neisseria iguanae TaxID=90242 RepID=A0A2P7U082_9NEIS|nr:NYN domain-containing protein [Neisseria iguanae]PSJ80382.1 hypothetical protein C7N83_06615 [Neisseria iguanae]
MSKIKTSFNVVEEKSARLAVLIDADNASARNVKAILDEVAKFGEATVKRIYGNFVSGNGQWKQVINEHAIKPMQQFAFTTGKNATDGFMIIDAMDLLYTNRFDGFCIVSSDSDFTALAIRLKEQGTSVYGFGKKQTPAAFRNACSQFIYVENLLPEGETGSVQQNTFIEPIKAIQNNTVIEQPASVNEVELMDLPINTIQKVFNTFDEEWVNISAFGATWKRLQVDFDPRSYGCSKFTTLIKKYPDIFDYEMRKDPDNVQEHMYVKSKI